MIKDYEEDGQYGVVVSPRTPYQELCVLTKTYEELQDEDSKALINEVAHALANALIKSLRPRENHSNVEILFGHDSEDVN
jgi:hypothetical protein